MTEYHFDNIVFDTARLRVLREGEEVAVQPRVLELLQMLIENRDRFVSKAEMIEVLWDGRAVSDDAITKRVALARKAIGDGEREKRLIRTSYGRGWRFVGAVTTGPAGAVAEATPQVAQSAGERGDIAVPDERPALALLPFRVTGAPGPFASIGEALPDDMTSALVKLRSLRVIARASAFRYAAADSAISRIAADLGARYVLAGRIETTGERVEVYVELVRAADEAVVWSDGFAGPLSDLHALRAEIVAQVANRVELEIPRQEAARAGLKMPDRLTAWDAYHLGQSIGLETIHPGYRQAALYFRKAVELAPGFARAHCALAYMHWTQFSAQNDRDDNREAMLEHSGRALELDPQDPLAHLAFGITRAGLGDMDAGFRHVGTTLDLAPNLARGHASLAGLQAATGKIDDSLASVGTAIALSPVDPHLPTWLAIRLVGNAFLGKLDAVRATATELSGIGSGQLVPLGWALAGYSMAGDGEGAQATADRLRTLLPADKPEGIPGDYAGIPAPMRALLTKAFRDYDLVT